MQNNETRKKVIETAIEMFNEIGCRAVTMDSIAAKLKISKRTLYEVFDNKEALLMECIAEVHRFIVSKRLENMKESQEPFLMALYIIRNETTLCLHYSKILNDAKKCYPKLTNRLLKNYAKRFKEALMEVFIKAEECGDLRSDINIKDIVDTIAMNINIGIINSNPNDGIQKKMLRETCYTFLRGLLSLNAITRYDSNEDKFRKILESTNHFSLITNHQS